MADQTFVASIADIKNLKDMPEEFIPYVSLKAAIEGRVLKGDEKIAILNVSTTTSYIAVFLEPGKSIKDVEHEVSASSATLNKDSRRILKDLLQSKEGLDV